MGPGKVTDIPGLPNPSTQALKLRYHLLEFDFSLKINRID
jgi:hypothetical protein